MRLMLDEMISPSLEKPLWEAGIDTASVRGRGLLTASDNRVWNMAIAEQRAIVTGNTAHFERLAQKAAAHYGVIALSPGGTRDTQFMRIMAALESVAATDDQSLDGKFAYVEADNSVLVVEYPGKKSLQLMTRNQFVSKSFH